jgi:hypothetical protein
MDAVTQVGFFVAGALKFSVLLSGYFFAVAAVAVALDLAIRQFSKVGVSPGLLVSLKWTATLLLISDLAMIGLLVLAHFGHTLRQLA